MNAPILFTALLLAQPQAPPLPQAPPVIVEKTKPSPDVAVYPKAYASAVQLNKPLVVFVNLKVRGIQGAVCCQLDTLNGNDEPRLMIAFPAGDKLKPGWNLEAEATDAEIRDALKMTGEAVRQSPAPFELPRRGGARRTAEGDVKAAGPWPKSVTFPDGLVRYKRAEFTQEIAVTDGRDRITPIPRRNLLAKWHQSGGMDGIRDFRSDVYKFIPEGGTLGVGNIDVWNGSNYQSNRGWKRSYPDGTRFFDSLSKDDVVFELRERSKKNGKWASKVVYSDHAARPEGYVGLTQSCASCHDEAGTGGYATGLVPGGDSVLSDPFAELER